MNYSESEIIDCMTEHIKHFLGKAHPVFGNMPICPFVNKARLENSILYKIYQFSAKEDLGTDSHLMKLIDDFVKQEHYEVLLVIHPNRTAISFEQVQQFIENLNQKISERGLLAFSGHPDDDFNIQGVYTRREPYPNFTVQSNRLIRESSKMLSKTRYYENWTIETLKQIEFLNL